MSLLLWRNTPTRSPTTIHEGLRRLFEEKGDQLACVIVEPVTGNMGVIEPTTAFRDAMMEVTLAYESVLIFDEVMTGFLASPQVGRKVSTA